MKRNKAVLWAGGVLLMLISSCSTSLQFSTQKASDPRFSGIRTVGVNTVHLVDKSNVELRDDLGRWTVSDRSNPSHSLETLVRKSLVSNLAKFSDYEVIDLHDLRKFQQAFQRLRPLSGERIGGLDAIIDVRISVHGRQQQGNSQELMTFRQQKSVVRNKKWVKVQDSSHQQVVTVPYSVSQVDIAAYVEVIKTKNGASNVLKSFNTHLSHNLEPMTSLETMINELGVVITGRILMDVSTYAVKTSRGIDKGSDKEVVALLEAANLNQAATLLESMTSRSRAKNPADLYNLGICYEAFGDPALALQMYREAHALDLGNELYIKAIGELE